MAAAIEKYFKMDIVIDDKHCKDYTNKTEDYDIMMLLRV